MNLDTQTAYFTEALRACRKARESGKERDLKEANAMLDQPEFSALPERAQIEVKDAYAAAASVVMGVDW
jgi:hypothetical protein